MGVFTMANPFPAVLSGSLSASLPVRRETPQPERTTAGGRLGAAPQGPLSQGKAHEARLQRTPEQQAEQDALAVLVSGCIAGDQRAWHTLVTTQHKRVYAICYRFTNDATDAEDITQDVFLKVYRNLASF